MSWDTPVAPGDPSGPYVVDRQAIANYARQFVGSNLGTDSSLGWNPNYPHFGNDCTNFASQALFAGGWPMQDGNGDGVTAWYFHNSTDYALPWTLAEYLCVRPPFISSSWCVVLADSVRPNGGIGCVRSAIARSRSSPS